jgi:hypothetical protein
MGIRRIASMGIWEPREDKANHRYWDTCRIREWSDRDFERKG